MRLGDQSLAGVVGRGQERICIHEENQAGYELFIELLLMGENIRTENVRKLKLNTTGIVIIE